MRQFPIRKHLAGAPHRACVCGTSEPSILVLETGVGRQRMEQALAWLLNQPNLPKLVISAGFSGALRDGLKIADVIVATNVVHEDGGCWSASWPGTIAHSFQCGKLLTVSRTIAEPTEKLALGQKHDAVAVDMETAIVARMCSERNVPFGCVRAISDDVHIPLSADIDHVIVNGEISLRRLAGRLLRRPWLAAELWRLAKHTRLAADRLALALSQLLVGLEAQRASM